MEDLIWMMGAGLLAGGMNAIAGGGTFVTLPALIASGMPAVAANATSTVALVPGSLISLFVYRAGLGPVRGVAVVPMLAASLLGGLFGSVLLLWTPAGVFDLVLPWLLLLATLALAFGRSIAQRIGRPVGSRGTMLAVQVLLGVYGGYFGGAVGLMMMAAWSLLGAGDIRALQAPRTLLVSAANIMAAASFVLAGAVRWPQGLAVLAGGLLGGYFGARLGRVLPAGWTRAVTVVATAGITAAFFRRAYG